MPGTLIYSPAEVIRKLLIDLGHGFASTTASPTDWSAYVDGEPDVPDSCITVYDTEGRKSGRTMTDGEIQEHHGFQIRIRAARHSSGYRKARAICIAMDQDV